MQRLPSYAPTVLRLGLIAVIVYFGTSQIMDQTMWVSFVPDWILNITGLSGTTFVLLNGIFEVLCSILLVFNLFTRLVAFLLFLHMCGIVLSIGISPTGVRDLGIAVGLLTLSLIGNSEITTVEEVS